MLEPDFKADGTIYEIKRAARGVRDVQNGLMQLAHYLADSPSTRGVLALIDVRLSEERLREEWKRFQNILNPVIARRIVIIAERDGTSIGIPHPPGEKARRQLEKHLASSTRTRPATSDRTRQADFWFVAILQILMHRLVKRAGAIRMAELAQAAGCTYPTVRGVLDQLGGVIERTSDRRVRLRWFPKPELARMAAVGPRIRRTMRFVDRSANPRTGEQHLKRFSALGIAGAAIGGVIGARHYAKDLDVIGSSRFDISMGPAWKKVEGAADDLAQRLDPGLIATRDPLAQATVVIHQVPYAANFFEKQGQRLYADPVDCLLDLYEARLDGPARELLYAISEGAAR
jgi:hypothetical protein